jgi:hypothetical protein
MSFEPSWKRLTAAVAGLFVAILAFLGARVALGGDQAVPATARAATQSAQPSRPQRQQQTTTPDQVAPPPSVAPRQQAPVDPNPPTTHSS